MKKIYHFSLYGLLLMLACTVFSSCIREDIQGNTPEANFESLWKIIDEQYCFLDYKKEVYGLDWDEVHTRYAKRISPSMSWEALFEVLSDMVNELRDGHVNLSSSLGSSQYREWFDAYPRNFSDSIQSNYLKKTISSLPDSPTRYWTTTSVMCTARASRTVSAMEIWIRC